MAISFLTSLASSIHPNMERFNPFHSHNAPYAFTSHSPLFVGRIFFDHEPCSKKNCHSLVSEHNPFFLNSSSKSSHLVIFTDGSHRDSRTGYGLVGYLEGKRIFQIVVPFVKDASNYDTKMFALAHAACRIKSIMSSNSTIKFIQIFSDASSAIEKIFNGSPHPSQDASIIFRSCFHKIFSWCPLLKCSVSWTPGHGGMAGMKLADSLAKQGFLSSRQPLFSFTSCSAALHNLKVDTLDRWKKHINDHPIEETSFFFPTSQHLHPHLCPPKWFKKMNRPLFSCLTQFATGHVYTGEYFKRSVKSKPTTCPCHSSGYPPVLHSWDHILRSCPLFESHQDPLRHLAPHLDNPQWSSGNLLHEQYIGHLLDFLSVSGAFSRGMVPMDNPQGALPPVSPLLDPNFHSPP